MDLLIRNGTVITAEGRYEADLAVQDGRIVLMGKRLDMGADQVIDASDKFVLPGAVDVHVHLQLPVGNFVSADSYESGTRAAACGGVTTVFDFVTPVKGQSLAEAIRQELRLFGEQACVDFGLHGVIPGSCADIAEELEKSAEMGVTSFKLYMVYKDLMADDGVLAEALEKSKETGTLIEVHAENPYIIDHRIKKFLSEGKTSAWYHYESRPEFVEAEAVKRAIHIAKSLSAPLYIVHLACREGMEEVTRARDEGHEIYAETCIHYLEFTNDVYKGDNGRYFVCSPPIKGEDSRNALWDGIRRGDISTVATDHCPFLTSDKDFGKDDFTKIPNGCMGTENLYPYMLSEANKGKITFEKVVEVCCANPARIFGCAPRKGSLTVGGDADIVLYDPKKDFVISKENMHSKTDYTIWEGKKLKGYPVMVFSRGRPVFKDGKFVGTPGRGTFIKCGKRSEK